MKIPIIIISSMDESCDQSIGWADWITKPIDTQQLKQSLGSIRAELNG